MNSGINPKENDYELAKANAVAITAIVWYAVLCRWHILWSF